MDIGVVSRFRVFVDAGIGSFPPPRLREVAIQFFWSSSDSSDAMHHGFGGAFRSYEFCYSFMVHHDMVYGDDSCKKLGLS
jgi:hypothetical protein